MTNEELFEDLKQFVQGAVSGLATQADLDALHNEVSLIHKQVSSSRDEVSSIRDEVSSMRSEMVEGMNQQTDTIIASIESLDHKQTARLDDHESRITRLEHRTT